MAIELQHLHPGHDDELSRLKSRIAELERMDTEHTLQIAKMNGYISNLEEERRWRKCSEENRMKNNLFSHGLPKMANADSFLLHVLLAENS